MSIVTFLFKKKRSTVVAEPTRASGSLPAARLILRPRASRAEAAWYEAFASGACDDALFSSLASLRGLNVAERERAAAAEVLFAAPPVDTASARQGNSCLLYH